MVYEDSCGQQCHKNYQVFRQSIENEDKNSTWIDSQPYDAYKRDIGIVTIFFSDKEITKFVKSNRMSTYGFLAQIGGSLGFAMGISIISVIEFVYWFTFQLFRNITYKKHGKIKNSINY